jgi:hypothetical protein
MLKILFINFLTLLSLNVSAQYGDTTIVVTKTSTHVNIPGTKLYVIIPEGFKIATNFLGLQKDFDTGFQVFDLDGGDFYSNGRNIRRETFEEKGVKVLEYRELTLGGYPAKYVEMEAGDHLVQNLTFGDSTFSSTINAVSLIADVQATADLKAALLSIYYDKATVIDPFKIAPFELDDSNSLYKFAKYASNMYMYSLNGEYKESYGTDPLFLLSVLPNDGTHTRESMADDLVSQVQKYGLIGKEFTSSNTIQIDGTDALERTFNGNLKWEKKSFYQLVIISKDRCIAIQASCNQGDEATLEEFKKLAQTLKLKKTFWSQN